MTEERGAQDGEVYEVRANLRLVAFDLTSLTKTGFIISVSIAVTLVVASIVTYLLLLGMGVLSSVDQVLGDLTGGAGTLTETLTLPVVVFGSIGLGAFEVLVTTALVTLFGFIYNLSVPFARGLKVTLAEDRVKID